MRAEMKDTEGTYVCGIDCGVGQSHSSFAVFKNGNLVYHTRKLWKAKAYIWWKSLFGKGIVIKEES